MATDKDNDGMVNDPSTTVIVAATVPACVLDVPIVIVMLLCFSSCHGSISLMVYSFNIGIDRWISMHGSCV
jgi:hypothetical protein